MCSNFLKQWKYKLNAKSVPTQCCIYHLFATLAKVFLATGTFYWKTGSSVKLISRVTVVGTYPC